MERWSSCACSISARSASRSAPISATIRSRIASTSAPSEWISAGPGGHELAAEVLADLARLARQPRERADDHPAQRQRGRRHREQDQHAGGDEHRPHELARRRRAPARASSRIASSVRSWRAIAVRTLSNASRPAASGGGPDVGPLGVDRRARRSSCASSRPRRRPSPARAARREPRVALELGERLDRLALGGAALLVRAAGSSPRRSARTRARRSPGRAARSRAAARRARRGRRVSSRNARRSSSRSSASSPATIPATATTTSSPTIRPNHCVTVRRRPPITTGGARSATRATSSASGPPLRSSARSTTSRTSSLGLRVGAGLRGRHDLREPGLAEPLAALPDPPVGHAVGVEQQRPRRPAARPRTAATRRRRARRAAGPGGAGSTAATAPSASSSGGGCPASRTVAHSRGGSSETMQSVVNTCDAWRSTTSTSCERAEQPVGRDAGQHERPPGDPEADAERRLVRAVAGDVADQRRGRCRRRPGRRRRSRRRAAPGGGPAGSAWRAAGTGR